MNNSNSLIYDFLIIGAGSAGSHIAYFLTQNGKKVAVLDKNGIAGGASGAAGAFLSPLPGKKNNYNSFINDALKFSLDFYNKLLPDGIDKMGVLRVENSNFNSSKLEDNYLKYKKKLFKNIDGYFYQNASMVNPVQICKILLKNSDFYNFDVDNNLTYQDNFYQINMDINNTKIKAKNIILTQGVFKSLFKSDYIKISPLFGVRIDIQSSTEIPFNIHKSISISKSDKNGKIAIGATQERHNNIEQICNSSCEKCSFYINKEKEDINYLLDEANKLIKLENVKLLKIYRGARATMKTYFPVIGKIIDAEKTLLKYPSIKNGTKIPKESFNYYPNSYILNGLGSRGFVLGSYTGKLLSDFILNNKDIPMELSTEKLFYKWSRKLKK